MVWTGMSVGLGNRIMTLVSAFVYALLTDRVLLTQRTVDNDELFCEPFPGTSWLLPEAFPDEWMTELNSSSSCRFGTLIRNGTFTSSHDGYAYLNLMHDYDTNDKRFFCPRSQAYLTNFPWLFLRSNQYFLPGLHFVPEFQEELDKLFPDRESVFHHIVRYLLHPSDSVWKRISSFYDSKLARSQHKVGLQIRIFGSFNLTTILDSVSATRVVVSLH